MIDPQILAERMSRADACPEACGNTEVPDRIRDTADGFIGYYECRSCGYFWSTAWRD